MKKLLLVVWLLSMFAHADGWCSDPVVRVMADNPNCVDSSGNLQLAYVLGSVTNKWLCARSSAGSSMILAAKISGKQVRAYVSVGSDCTQYSDYDVAPYIWIDETQ